jgi:hypothetical protein
MRRTEVTSLALGAALDFDRPEHLAAASSKADFELRNIAVAVDFVANDPGPSFLHCHMQQYMDHGFKVLVKYQ